MTVSTTTSLAGPYAANGATRDWVFNFKVFDATELVLLLDDGAGVITEVTTGFNVTGVGVSSGGTVEYPIAPAAMLAAPVKLTLERRVPYTQPTSVGNQGAFFASTHEKAWDRLVMMAQQIYSFARASLRAPPADGAVDLVLPAVAARASKMLGFDASGLPIAAGNSADLTALSGNAAASAASAATASAAATSAAASYDLFDDRFLGSKSSNPTLDNDGNALATGAIYWNTTSTVLRIWNGASWQDALTPAAGSVTANMIDQNEASVASAATTDLGAVNSIRVQVTGTVTITSLGSADDKFRVVRFAAALTLTHGASLILPGAANLVTAANDVGIFATDSAGVWRCLHYQRAAEAPGRLKSKVVAITRDVSSATASLGYTGVGFKPTSIRILGAATSSTTNVAWGFCDSALNQGGVSMVPAFTGFFSNSVAFLCGSNATGQAGTVTSFDTDGFTVSWVKNGAPGAQVVTFYVECFQ